MMAFACFPIRHWLLLHCLLPFLLSSTQAQQAELAANESAVNQVGGGDSNNAVISNPNPCFYGWSEPIDPVQPLPNGFLGISDEPLANPRSDQAVSLDACRSASDCGPADAWCMFSPMVQRRICCQNRRDAVLPQCPPKPQLNGQQFLRDQPAGPVNGIILCTPTAAGENEPCQEGFACVQSQTQFQKSFPGQPNTICCPQ